MHPNPPICWQPSPGFISGTHLHQFGDWLLVHKNLAFEHYHDLWQWSVSNPEQFWESVWHYFAIISHTPYQQVMSQDAMPGTRWFEGATLNYSEHIFRNKTTSRPALLYVTEHQPVRKVQWDELEQKTAAIAAWLTSKGIKKGDCVAAYLPNIPETIQVFLAVNSLGAVWSCCSPDFGVNTVIDRFSQIEPRILFSTDGYRYNGTSVARIEETTQIHRQISTITDTIIIPSLDPAATFPGSPSWQQVLDTPSEGLSFTPVPFSHPIWVLYSSGTTGKPKAITHSHGGVLLEHLKYMHFHNDVRAGENFFWFTTTGWMMWNFLQASLLAGATAVLYDGSPAYPDLQVLWDLAATLPIHHFGTSAPFLTACMKKGLSPLRHKPLPHLRSIGSTGAPLPPEAFDWVYQDVSPDVWLCSMSGGTDVCTAFVGGCPTLPVYRGHIQARTLGCALYAYDDDGRHVTGQLGEMVIEVAMPSMPVYFWNDPDGSRYHASYFDRYKDKWCHGDWIQLSPSGSLTIQGRSDATLNRKGIRIGTAEIYAVLDTIEGISDGLIVNLEQPDGSDIMPLF
ncbi:MAG: acetoacetate--CoA ligase, partial [Cyclobacteriaceae bacterium]|nr:acetoacetate--CoA ligase [Cyclobacteriaceae bacterium]